jgi:uncharacterized membrane protein YdjX (TVP38/TMEM64 family)
MTRGEGRRQSVRWGWTLLGVAALGLVVGWRLLPLEEWIAHLQRWVARMGVLGGLAFALLYLAAALLFVPGSLLTIAAGLAFGLSWGVLVVSVASTAAAGAGFLIGRHLARDRVERLARRHEKFAAIDRAIREKGWKVVALLRLSPVVPFSISNYLYGLTAVDFWPYLLASWAAMLPGTVLYVYIGAAGRAAAAGGRHPWEWALFATGLLATVVVTVWLSRTARRELEAARVGRKP